MAVLTMKRFRFHLQQILKLREQKKRQAELHQQQVKVELQAARAQVAALEERLAQSAAALLRHERQTMSVAVWMNGSQHAVRVNDALNAAKENASQVERRLNEADQQRVTATTQAESVLFLRERQWVEHQQEEARKAQDLMDEAAMRRWNGNSKDRIENESISPWTKNPSS